nr:galactose/lactose metabolism regulatory protein gal80 [Quercus suber]
MSPLIRIGMIGLSASSSTSWATVAHLPYLLSAHGKSKYEIVALCNSSVESAKLAVEAFGLSTKTKTYGDAADLAADPDIDLVVCSVRVDKHYETIRPSLAAGKDVFCEWPLASNLAQVRELVDLARKQGVKTMIGTQRRASPLMLKVGEVLRQGRIGKILSSEVRAAGGANDRLSMSGFMGYFTQLSAGGNIVTITTAHRESSPSFLRPTRANKDHSPRFCPVSHW